MDRFGNKYFPKELLVDPFDLECNGAGYFALDFSGGFTTEEKNTICQVFQDLSNLIVSAQNEIPIRIVKTLTPTGVYGAASAIWRNDVFTGGCGIDRSLIWEHINSNVSYDGVLQENYFAGIMRISNDLDDKDWHTLDLDGTGGFNNPTITSNHVDLYSVVLHETLHMIGFESLMKANGDPTNGLYAPWDQFLVQQTKMFGMTSNTSLIEASENETCCDYYTYNFWMGDHLLGLLYLVVHRASFLEN